MNSDGDDGHNDDDDDDDEDDDVSGSGRGVWVPEYRRGIPAPWARLGVGHGHMA